MTVKHMLENESMLIVHFIFLDKLAKILHTFVLTAESTRLRMISSASGEYEHSVNVYALLYVCYNGAAVQKLVNCQLEVNM